MNKYRQHWVFLLVTLLGFSCTSEDLKKSDDHLAKKTATAFIDAMQNLKFGDAYDYLHENFKSDWRRRPVTLLDFSGYVSNSKFSIPENYISKIMEEPKQNDWPKNLFIEIMKLAHQQNAFPVDVNIFSSPDGKKKLLGAGKGEKIYSVSNDLEKRIDVVMSFDNESSSWKILRIVQINGNSVLTWPEKEYSKIR